MNKTTTVVAALVLLNCFSYSSASELKTMKDYVQEIEQKTAEIKRLRRELGQLRKQLQEKDKEIERLKELCFKNGVDISEEEPAPIQKGIFKRLDKPMFGVHLGEDFTQLGKRFTTKPVDVQNEFRKSYLLNVNSPNINYVGVLVFNNQVSVIIAKLSDASSSNYEAVLSQIKAKYRVIDEDEPISTDDEHIFKTSVDGEEVWVNVTREEKFMEEDELRITYAYARMIEFITQKEEDKKAAKIKDEL